MQDAKTDDAGERPLPLCGDGENIAEFLTVAKADSAYCIESRGLLFNTRGRQFVKGAARGSDGLGTCDPTSRTFGFSDCNAHRCHTRFLGQIWDWRLEFDCGKLVIESQALLPKCCEIKDFLFLSAADVITGPIRDKIGLS